MAGAIPLLAGAVVAGKGINQFQEGRAQQANLLGRKIATSALLGGMDKQIPARAGVMNSGMTMGPDGNPVFNPTQGPATPARPAWSQDMQTKFAHNAAPELAMAQILSKAFPAPLSKEDFVTGPFGAMNIRNQSVVPGTAPKPEGPKEGSLREYMQGPNKVYEAFEGGRWVTKGSGPAFAPQKPDRPLTPVQLHETNFGPLPQGYSPVVDAQGLPTGQVKPATGGPVDPAVLATQKETERASKIEQERPDAEKNLNSYISGLDIIENTAKSIRTAPNLASVTGPIQGRTPSFGQKNANLDAKIKALGAQLSVAQLANMKSQGLSTGTITESEWPRFESLVTSLDQIQDEEQFASAMSEIESFTKKLKDGAKTAFQKKYGMASGPAIAANEKPPINAQSIVDELRRRGVVN